MQQHIWDQCHVHGGLKKKKRFPDIPRHILFFLHCMCCDLQEVNINMEGCSFALAIQSVLFVYLLACGHYMGCHHDQQTKTCGVEITRVLALVLVGRGLYERV